MRKIPKYIAKCHSKGIKTSLITNGLILDKKIDTLVKNGLNQIIISVDGSTPQLHNSLRGVKGLFEKIDKTLKIIKNNYPTLHTRVNTVVSEKNITDISNIVRWLDKNCVNQWSIIPIKLDKHKWCNLMKFEEFEREYINFQNAIKDCNVELMGYSAEWAGKDIEQFWKGDCFIRPKGDCNITNMVTFYNPFSKCFYPCNCIPHRKNSFDNGKEEINWYFKHGHEFCEGCEPLNAFCADFPEMIDKNIFNF